MTDDFEEFMRRLGEWGQQGGSFGKDFAVEQMAKDCARAYEEISRRQERIEEIAKLTKLEPANNG